MTTPTYCTSCGHELGIGRFCTNCGQPVPGRHPEAAPGTDAPSATTVAAAAQPVVPPPTGQLPPAARYPLFADGAPPAPPATYAAPPPPPAPPSRGGAAWLPWVIAVVVVALVAGVGAFLVVRAGGDSTDDPGRIEETDRAGDGGSTPQESSPVEPDSTGTGAAVAPPAPGDVVDLTAQASAQVPATAPASRDRDNRPVTFEARNMLDGRPRTSWRMAGDGTGASLTFDLGQEVVLTEVGLINGYAKVDGADNWYGANRRISAVQWEFDDGTRITQDLTDRQRVQLMPVGPVATTRVVLHLVAVTPPGRGPNGRDFTAISEVRFRGAAG